MMNAASSSLDPYQASMPHNGDPNSYAGLPMQPYYVDNFAHPSTRGPMMDQMPMAEGMAPLAPMTPAPAQQAAPVDFQSHSFVHEGRKYELQVVQQPKRARMCGFGDKDRRPITPPPCVRVIITDVASGNEVDCNEIDHGMFVLNVDLWTEDGRREVNLIRHTATASPAALSISSTAPASFSDAAQAAAAYTNSANMRSEPPTPHFKYEGGPSQESPFQAQAHPPYSPYTGPPTAGAPYTEPSVNQPYGDVAYQQGYSQPPMMSPAGFPPNSYQTQVPMYYPNTAGMHPQAQGVQPGMDYGLVSQPLMGGPPGMNPYEGTPYHAADQEVQRNPVSPSHPGGMFTRNLIGSLAASAFRLTDPDDRIGIWFVLQDLSVRAEGLFRLRFSFVNVGVPGGPNTPASDPNSQYISSGAVNTGKAPVLASCFSEVFTVYSAKKFPGVVESTHLSKCFATQGIKIPIRKEAKNGKDRDEYDED